MPFWWMTFYCVSSTKCHSAECHPEECHSAQCHSAQFHSAQCHSTECHSACHAAKCRPSERHSALYHASKCHSTECHSAECHSAECLSTKCHSAECRSTQKRWRTSERPSRTKLKSDFGHLEKLFWLSCPGARKFTCVMTQFCVHCYYYFFGLSGFWTKAQNKESQNWLYSVCWLWISYIIIYYIIIKL